jgi:hypothetical protein
MTIFVEGAKTRLGVQKTRKDKKVTGSQDDDFVERWKTRYRCAKAQKDRKKSQALKMTILWGS